MRLFSRPTTEPKSVALSVPSFTQAEYERLVELTEAEVRAARSAPGARLASVREFGAMAATGVAFISFMGIPIALSQLLLWHALIALGVTVLGCFAVLLLSPDEPKKSSSILSAEDRILAVLGRDPLGWPAFALNPRYEVLHSQAMGAVKEFLYPEQLPLLKQRWNDGGTVGEQVALLRGQELPAIRTVTVQHVERVQEQVPSGADPDARIEGLRARHQELALEYGNFLTDPVAALRWPLLNDVTDPSTADFVEAYAGLTALPSEGQIDPDRYESVLTDAWKSWRSAKANAEKRGLKGLSTPERKKVQRARALLDVALNDGATEFERAAAYTQVQKLVSGLVTLPPPTREAIEAKVRLALPQTPTTSSLNLE